MVKEVKVVKEVIIVKEVKVVLGTCGELVESILHSILLWSGVYSIGTLGPVKIHGY